MEKTDPDLAWLGDHAPVGAHPALHEERVDRLIQKLSQRVLEGKLPFTVGLFGGWGSGKTTFLSILARRIPAHYDWSIVYFNAWKYAGFMEIVPSLIYKILKYGNRARIKNPEEAIRDIMVSLGKEYSGAFGEWAKSRIGLNFVGILKDVSEIYSAVQEGVVPVPDKVIEDYYTQIDRAQDLLRRAFQNHEKITVVMIDELDRCDPDEAFSVIKQLRVFFAMNRLPMIFIICANPEPIGLAIQHKYGLSASSGNYEARRILEKFLDDYEDMSEPIILDSFVQWLWKSAKKKIGDYALIPRLDAAYVTSDFYEDTTKNATALQAMRSDNPLYGNLRLLRKTLDRVCTRPFSNDHMLWTAWHLELAEQMDPAFRREIRRATKAIEDISTLAYTDVLKSPLVWENGKLQIQDNRDGTLFGFYRSKFWERSRKYLKQIDNSKDPEDQDRSLIINSWMRDHHRMTFISILSLLPVANNITLKSIIGVENLGVLLDNITDLERFQFAYLLANY